MRTDIHKEFEQEGFLVHDFQFSDALLEECAAVTAQYIGQAGRVQELWRRETAVKTLASHPEVISILSELYGREAFPFQTLNFMRGTEDTLHSDTLFFDSKPAGYMCGVWVALEDIDMDNGPLVYYAKSHKLPVADLQEIQSSPQKRTAPFYEAQSRNFEKKYGTIKKGQAIIWSSNLLHGGAPVIDKSRTRLSQVTHYYFKGCAYHTPLYENVETGQNFWRSPYNIREGRFVLARENGKIKWPKPRHLISDVANIVFRRTHAR